MTNENCEPAELDGREQQKPVLAHELTHALQDQSFGIEKWMKGSAEELKTKRMNQASRHRN